MLLVTKRGIGRISSLFDTSAIMDRQSRILPSLPAVGGCRFGKPSDSSPKRALLFSRDPFWNPFSLLTGSRKGKMITMIRPFLGLKQAFKSLKKALSSESSYLILEPALKLLLERQPKWIH